MSSSLGNVDIFRLLKFSASVSMILMLAFLFISSIYRVTFHPLAKFPGPFLAKFTYLYSAYHALRGDLHVDIWRCHEKYGEYVRYGPNSLLVNSSEGLREIYANAKHVKKSIGYNMMVHRMPNTFTEINKKSHERKRRLMSPGFSEAALRSYEPRIHDCIQVLLNLISESSSDKTNYGWTVPMNMGDLAAHFAFDVMTTVIYGISYNLLQNDTHRSVVPAVTGLNVRMGVICQAPVVGWRKIDRLLFVKAIQCGRTFLKFVSTIMTDRLKSAELSEDVFSKLLAAKDPDTGASLDMRQLHAESVNLIVAGFDTTATTIAATTFYFTRYPDAYEKAAREVRSIFRDASEVRLGAKLNSCVYLRACINESMRLSPPVGRALSREVLPGGMVIGGHYIPEGCNVGTGIYSIHHHPDYFEDPFVFRPERWRNTQTDATDPSVEGSARELAYNPFSLGARSCIGKALAINELMLTFASLFAAFDFQTAHCEDAHMGEGSKDSAYGFNHVYQYQMTDYLVGCRNGPMVEFRPRRDLAAH